MTICAVDPRPHEHRIVGLNLTEAFEHEGKSARFAGVTETTIGATPLRAATGAGSARSRPPSAAPELIVGAVCDRAQRRATPVDGLRRIRSERGRRDKRQTHNPIVRPKTHASKEAFLPRQR